MSGETILIVEDNPLNLELISDILEAHGYRVQSAISGSDALKMVEEEKPDLILMDIQLPGLDGLTITGMIKERPGFEKPSPRARGGVSEKWDKEMNVLHPPRAREEGSIVFSVSVIGPQTLPARARRGLNTRALAHLTSGYSFVPFGRFGLRHTCLCHDSLIRSPRSGIRRCDGCSIVEPQASAQRDGPCGRKIHTLGDRVPDGTPGPWPSCRHEAEEAKRKCRKKKRSKPPRVHRRTNRRRRRRAG